MKRISDALHEADPLRDDPALPLEEVRTMRRLVIDAARRDSRPRPFWPQPVAVAVVVAAMIGVGVTGGRRLPPVSTGPAVRSPGVVRLEGADDRRQLQFATPGGTRIIWVFDPDFTVKETMP